MLTLALALGAAGAGPGLSAHAPMGTIVGYQESGEPVRVRDVMVEKAKLARVKFLPKADLSHATFPEVDLSEAVMVGVNVSNATFLSVKLSKTRMQGADMSGAEFRKGTWEDPDFSGVVMKGTIFNRVRMIRPDFRGTDRTAATFAKCLVEDALETGEVAGPGAVEAKAAGAGAGPGAGAGKAAPATKRKEERKAPAQAEETAAAEPVTARDRKWEKNFEAFKAFVDGNPGVPVPGYVGDKMNPLSSWLIKRRAELRRGKMPSGRRSRFEAQDQKYKDGLDGKAAKAGASTAWDRLWQQTCDEFEAFIDERPGVAVPSQVAGKVNPLYQWHQKQKKALQDETMEAWRRERFTPLLQRYQGGLPVSKAKAGAGASTPARAKAAKLPPIPAGGSSPARPAAEPIESKGAGSGSGKLPALSAKKPQPKAPATSKKKEAADQAWEKNFKKMEAFMAEHPSERTPNPGGGKKGPLTQWLVNNRTRIKHGVETSPSRIERFRKLDAAYQASLED